jgi:hypothetical protein
MSNDRSQAKGRSSGGHLTPQEVERLFEGGYRDIEILPDGTLRETVRGGSPSDEAVTRTLKTERTWY